MIDMCSENDVLMSIVVCAYNEEKILDQCIESLMDQDFPKDRYEIIIVDDESTDQTSNIATRWAERGGVNAPRFRYIRIQHGGLSVARNMGIKNASGSLVAFIDGDAKAPRDWVQSLVNGFKDPSISVLGGRVRLLNTESWFARVIHDSFFSSYMDGPHSVIGTNMAFRRDVLLNNAFFHPVFMRRGDESYVFSRLKDLCRPVHDKRVSVYHECPESPKEWFRTIKDSGYFGSINMFLKKGGRALFYKTFVGKFVYLMLPIVAMLGLLIKAELSVVCLTAFMLLLFKKLFFSGYLANTVHTFLKRRSPSLVEKLLYIPMLTGLALVSTLYLDYGFVKGCKSLFHGDIELDYDSEFSTIVKEVYNDSWS